MKNRLLFLTAIAGGIAYAAVLMWPAMAQEYRELQSATYRSSNPPFEISIPKECLGWHIRYASLKGKPILIVKEKNSGMPFIDTSVSFYADVPADIKLLWPDSYRLLELVAANAEKNEKEVIKDVEFLISQRVTIFGLPGYDRIFRSKAIGITYHYVYLLFPQAIVQFSLNTKTTSFDENNSDFVVIVNSIKRL
jgi:hypothetical protein